MDHIRILKRAWEITWNYRILWLFGFLVALTTSRGGGGNGGGGSGTSRPNPGGSTPNFPFNFPTIPQPAINTLITVGIALLCFVILLGIILAIVRYVSNTALIRMTNDYEATGEKVSARTGFRLGWSRAAFRMWLIDLLFGLGGFLVFVLALLVGAAPLLLLLTKDQTLSIIGGVMAAGLIVLFIFVFVLVAIALSVLMQFFYRAIVIEDLGVMDAIRRGWTVARGRAVDVVIMGLILFAIGLAIAVVMIPVIIALVLVGAIAGGLPGLLVGWITSLFAHGATPVIVGVLVGIPIFLLVLIIPSAFLGGIAEVFTSSTWTLTYREAVALETMKLETPNLDAPTPPVEE